MNKRKHSSSCSGLSIGPLFLAVVLIAAAAWYISGHWFQLMVITGDSMSPTYHSGQFTAIDRHDRSFGEGDVVALRCENLHAILVKRIAAGPGDTVVITGIYNDKPGHFTDEYADGLDNIYTLLRYAHFDGIIFPAGRFNREDVRERIFSILRNLDTPCVVLEHQVDDFECFYPPQREYIKHL